MELVKYRPEINFLKRFLVIFILAFSAFLIFDFDELKQSYALQNKNRINLVKEQNLRKHLFEIASDEYEGRGAGHRGERKAAEYIANHFKEYGLKPAGDKLNKKRTYFQYFKFHARKPLKSFQTLDSQNVLGFIEGSDKKLKKEIVVIGCHYDGQGMKGQSDGGRYEPKDKNSKDFIWNSADDNATSVAVLLEVARIISEQKLKPKRSILFIAFGAEEHALNGSAFYVENPVFKWKRHYAMLNLEKLGRIPEGTPITASGGTSPIWEKITNIANQKTGMEVKSLIPELISDTDHYPFAMRKLPAMVIGMAHEKDTHLPTDSVDKISFDKLAERTNYVLTAFLELANSIEKMSFTGDLSNEVGFMPVVASRHEIKQIGLGSNRGGYKVSMIISNFPADKAGLKLGDVIIAMDGKNFTDKDTNERVFFKENVSAEPLMKLTIIRKGKRKIINLKIGN